jgi:nitroimidazol reductase NimA-like FMN-containing flavoprotein (pyridoxamine 5'-phosphate oxidase superfamily)
MFFHDDVPRGLSEPECQQLLAGANFGRLSLTIRALPIIMPVNYGYLGGSITLGMNDGPARRAISGGNVVALGVDSGPLTDDFWAVLVIGRAAGISDPTREAELRSIGLTDLTGAPAQHFLQLQPDIISGYRVTI